MNTVTLLSDLTHDPELVTLEDDQHVINFKVRSKLNNTNQFFMCEAWNQVAEPLIHARKGDWVRLKGSLIHKRWYDSKVGSNRYNVVIRTDQVQVIKE